MGGREKTEENETKKKKQKNGVVTAKETTFYTEILQKAAIAFQRDRTKWWRGGTFLEKWASADLMNSEYGIAAL